MFSTDRAHLRQKYIDAWSRAKAGKRLTPLQKQIADVVRMHPEYQLLLQDPDGILDRDWLPELGESNPFLHMALHLSLLEQISTDRPRGIRRLHHALVASVGDAHEAEHRMMECLATAIWHIQREDKPFNEKPYLKCVKRSLGGRHRGG